MNGARSTVAPLLRSVPIQRWFRGEGCGFVPRTLPRFSSRSPRIPRISLRATSTTPWIVRTTMSFGWVRGSRPRYPPLSLPLSHGWGGGADPSSLHPPAVRPALPPSRIGAWSSCSRRDPFPWNWGVVCPFEWLNRGELHPLGTKVHGNLGIGSPRYHLHPPQHTWCNARTSKDNVPREARGWPSLGHADQAIRREVEVAWAKERHEEEPRDRAGKRIGTVASVSGKKKKKDSRGGSTKDTRSKDRKLSQRRIERRRRSTNDARSRTSGKEKAASSASGRNPALELRTVKTKVGQPE